MHPETYNAQPEISKVHFIKEDVDSRIVLVENDRFEIFMHSYSFTSFMVRDVEAERVYKFDFRTNDHMKHYLNWNSTMVLEDITLALL